MKYLFLLNNTTADWDRWRSLPPDEVARLRAGELPRWEALFAWMDEQKIEWKGVELDDPTEVRVIRVRDGETIVTDGPYAETKEVLGGYFLADCKNLDQAIELAQRVPLVVRGSVEIRPLVQN